MLLSWKQWEELKPLQIRNSYIWEFSFFGELFHLTCWMWTQKQELWRFRSASCMLGEWQQTDHKLVAKPADDGSSPALIGLEQTMCLENRSTHSQLKSTWSSHRPLRAKNLAKYRSNKVRINNVSYKYTIGLASRFFFKAPSLVRALINQWIA